MNLKETYPRSVREDMTQKYIFFLPRYVALSFVVVLMVLLVTPSSASATTVEVSGWIPYWRHAEGIKDAKKHIDDIDTLFPFSYSVTTNGELRDLAGMNKSDWRKFLRTARSEDVEIIPTVMWSDGAAMERILSDKDLREEHVGAIIEMVKDGKYDGVDIDYEGKLAQTKNSFSRFLEELKDELGSKILSCTIEARTPPISLYTNIPATLEYANDYEEIAKHCDRVQLMAYDQQRADLKLNESKSGEPYMPVADVDWVRKVVVLALETIPNEKLVLGIPTYGHHYEVTVAPNWYQGYRRIGALNLPDMLEVADDYGVEPGRNKSGEMSFTYFPESSVYKLLRGLPVPVGTREGNEAAARALLFANATGQSVPVNLGWYSDAGAISGKIDLAEEFNLKGVALFKIDGDEDRDVWKLLED